MDRRFQLCVVLVIASGVLAWQLFVPPIVGLADQGDFVRVLGPLGYAPVPKGPEHKYSYLTREFVRDPSYREPRWEQISSEMVLARVALVANRVIGRRDSFDLTLFGFTHTVVFLFALGRLLWVTKDLANYWLIWTFLLLVLTDAGYVAYWNSLYTEPASCLWFLFLLAESISLLRGGGSILRWDLFGVLWITAKSQNAALCLPLAVYGWVLASRAVDQKARYTALVGVFCLVLAGVLMYRSVPATTKVAALYNVIFFGILPESPDPRADLASLGLDPEYARYSATVAWSAGTGVGDGRLVDAIESHVSTFDVLTFYAKRPARLWTRLGEILPGAFSLRPEFCGNFDRSAGRLPGERSGSFSVWTYFHERNLGRIPKVILGGLSVFLIGGLLLCGRGNRWLELGVLLAACCLISFGVAGFADAWDNVKHQFLFNLLLDACLVMGFVGAVTSQGLVPRGGLANILSVKKNAPKLSAQTEVIGA